MSDAIEPADGQWAWGTKAVAWPDEHNGERILLEWRRGAWRGVEVSNTWSPSQITDVRLVDRPVDGMEPTPFAAPLGSGCLNCRHDAQWHRAGVGCVIEDCPCGLTPTNNLGGPLAPAALPEPLTRDELIEALSGAEHAPMFTHSADGECTVCPVPLYECGPEAIADALLVKFPGLIAGGTS